jgi:uncharacterized membrane protein
MIELIGRLHPAIVHLPIGIFVLAFIFQYIMPLKSGRDELIRFVLVVSLIFSLLATAMGWILSWNSEYAEATVDQHKWPAIFFTMASGLLIPLHIKAPSIPLVKKIYHGLFFVSMVLLMVAGHRGGSLTHGEDYLSLMAFQDEDDIKDTSRIKPNISDTSMTPIFSALVQPMLEEKCVKCHNEKKIKGGLRMDQFALLMKGGKNGVAVERGDAENSLLIQRTLLELDDEKHMPPKGKKQLSEQELALLYWWVHHGASATAPIRDHIANDTINPFIASKNEQPIAVVLPEVKAPDSLALVALVKIGFHVTPVANGSHLLEISAINMPALKDEDLKLLKPVAENVLWLHLADRDITDQGIAHISGFKNLRRLDLRHSKMTDASAAVIGRLTSLEYLNLVGTQISDMGLAQWKDLGALKQLYCWETNITPTGLELFKRSNPVTKVYQAIN